MSVRINKVSLIAGRRNSGKTDYLKNLIMVSAQQVKFIIDTFDSPVWHTMKTWNHPDWSAVSVPSIPVVEIYKHKSGIHRIFSSDTDYIMDVIQQLAFNSLLVFEDATKYFGKSLTKDQKMFILDSKQKNLDIILTFHSLADISIDLLRYSDYLTLFKTSDVWNSNLKSKYQGKPVEELWKMIHESPSPFYNKTIEISG